MGLGLSIACETMRRHGGYIEVGDEPLPTTFVLWLPTNTGLALESQPAKPLGAAASPASLLIVDDDKLVRNSLRRVLEHHHDVTVVSSGERALTEFRARSSDLVLCDLSMPVVSGKDLHEAVRQTDPSQAERFVFLTGAPAWSPREASWPTCPIRVLTNPSADEILALVARCLERFSKPPS